MSETPPDPTRPDTQCPKCGTRNPHGVTECLYCGTNMSPDGTSPAPRSRPALSCGLGCAAIAAMGLLSLAAYRVFLAISAVTSLALAAYAVRALLTARRRRPVAGPTGTRSAPGIPVVGPPATILTVLACFSALNTVWLAALFAYGVYMPAGARSLAFIDDPWLSRSVYAAVVFLLVGLVTWGAVLGIETLRPGARTLTITGLLAVVSSMAMPLAAREATGARKIGCLTNVRSLSLAVTMYLADNDNTLPRADDWCEALTPYCETDDPLHCPETPKLDCAFAYNAALAGVMYDALADPSRTIAIFESDTGWNAAGGPELLTRQPRHRGGDNLGFPDGHATWVARPRSDSADPKRGYRRAYPDEWGLRWKP